MNGILVREEYYQRHDYQVHAQYLTILYLIYDMFIYRYLSKTCTYLDMYICCVVDFKMKWNEMICERVEIFNTFIKNNWSSFLQRNDALIHFVKV